MPFWNKISETAFLLNRNSKYVRFIFYNILKHKRLLGFFFIFDKSEIYHFALPI